MTRRRWTRRKDSEVQVAGSLPGPSPAPVLLGQARLTPSLLTLLPPSLPREYCAASFLAARVLCITSLRSTQGCHSSMPSCPLLLVRTASPRHPLRTQFALPPSPPVCGGQSDQSTKAAARRVL